MANKNSSGTITGYTVYHHITDHLGSVRAITNASTGNVVETSDFLPFGTRWSQTSGSSSATLTDATNRWRYSGKEEQKAINSSLPLIDYGARIYDPTIARWMSVDPMAEKYYEESPFLYCSDNPINIIDIKGTETHVVQNDNGTYTVIGGTLNRDRNIYVYTKDINGYYSIKGSSIGITSSTTSFYNADADNGKGSWAIGSVINPHDNSGDAFLGDIFANTPAMIDEYMLNATNNGKYDFKVTNGTDAPIKDIDPYRGMPIGITANGETIYSSARDIGNIAAGYIAGSNGISWKTSRIVFDTYQSKVSGRPSIESISTRNAEYYGWRIGSNINNNHPAKQAANLLHSIWHWLSR